MLIGEVENPDIEELDATFSELEELAEIRSDDAEKKVGASIYSWVTKDYSAFNTFINGAKGLPNTRPDKYQYIIHAEANLVNWAAKNGFSLEGRVVVCTLSPCQNCIRTLFQAGVREIYYKDTHRDHNPEMLDIKVTEEPYGPYVKMVLSNYE